MYTELHFHFIPLPQSFHRAVLEQINVTMTPTVTLLISIINLLLFVLLSGVLQRCLMSIKNSVSNLQKFPQKLANSDKCAKWPLNCC